MSVEEGMKEIIEEFLAESSELLGQVETLLVAAEHDELADGDVAAVFRALHTVKGTAAFLGFTHISTIAHEAEHLLSKVRDHELTLDMARVEALISTVDALREMLSEVETTGSDGDNAYEELLGLIGSLAREQNGEAASAGVNEAAAAETAQPADEEPADAILPSVDDTSVDDTIGAEHIPDVPEIAAEDEVVAHLAGAQVAAGKSGTTKQAASASPSETTSIRVDVQVLDRLIDLVGELVLARNQLVAAGIELGTAGQRLNHVVTELQEGIMRTRMQPVATLFAKAPRIARDAAQAVDRSVRVEIDAGDTELDRGVLEAIRDPLTHLIRNAVDHGIERTAERIQAGKSAEGLITVRAWHDSGHVVVEVRDDGRGIDPTKVKAKAVERGLLDAAAAEVLTDREVHQLLMLPGFSTAESVTSVSGRGVGMDVVRANIERIGGSVEVESQLGTGTAWKLRIPLTLAILPVLVVVVGPHRLAVPATSLREALRIHANEVEMLGGRRWLRLRGALLPLVDVGGVLDAAVEETQERLRVVVVGDGSQRVGLVVDEIGDPAEIVVKPLGTLLSGITELAGATVMGDGRIAYILDVTRLAARDGLDGSSAGAQDRVEEEAQVSEKQDVIVARRGDVRLAFAVGDVDRLERFSVQDFENALGRCVVQYRGSLLPISQPDPSGYVIVCRKPDGGTVGVGVESIDDVADVQIDEDGTVVVDGRVADRVIIEEVWA